MVLASESESDAPDFADSESDNSHDALEAVSASSMSSMMVSLLKVSVARRGTCRAGRPPELGTVGRIEMAAEESRRRKDMDEEDLDEFQTSVSK